MGSDSGKKKTLEHVGPGPAPEGAASAETAYFETDDVVPGTRYRIVRHIGDGGMGQVYEVAHLDIERRAALKVLLPQMTRTENAARMFREEARTASKLGADEIIEIYDFFELPDGRVGFVMELLEGEMLSDELQSGPIPADRAIGILRQLCKGLEAAHDAGVIHRDIKPENICLTHHKGRSDRVKLLDFGIAAMMQDGVAVEERTAGTPLYLSPELIVGEPFDHRADIYALGCVAYEMLAGTSPFETEDNLLASVLRKHLEETPERPSKIRPGIPKPLEAVVMRCIDKEPDDRFPDVASLEAALCEAQIEAKLTTTSDDLPLPHKVDPLLRERLLREMPDMVTGSQPAAPRTSWVWPSVAGLSLVIAVAAVVTVSSRDRGPSPADQAAIDAEPKTVEELVQQAREAAARNHYVYPPASDPQQATAYNLVTRLESMQGPDRDRAMREALELRMELSEMLVHLGDAYWQRDAGREYAVDFYKQALVFDRSHPRAIERVGATDDEIQRLADKADSAEFSPEDMKTSEALAVLAEPDKNKRRRKLATIRRARGGGSTEANGPGPSLELAEADVPSGSGEAVSEPAPETEPVTDGPTVEPFSTESEAESEVENGPGARARAEAARLTRSAKKAYASGQHDRAATLLGEALAAAPNYVPALSALYDLHQRDEHWTEAASIALRLTKAEPQRPLHFIRLGDARIRQGNPSGALEAYRRADELGSAKARTRVAKLERKLGIQSAGPASKASSSPPQPDEPADDGPSNADAADTPTEPQAP